MNASMHLVKKDVYSSEKTTVNVLQLVRGDQHSKCINTSLFIQTPHIYTNPSHLYKPLTFIQTPHIYTNPSHLYKHLTFIQTPHSSYKHLTLHIKFIYIYTNTISSIRINTITIFTLPLHPFQSLYYIRYITPPSTHPFILFRPPHIYSTSHHRKIERMNNH